MLVRVDLLGVGTDENEPCENKPWNDEFATCNNWNGFERTRQFRSEALRLRERTFANDLGSGREVCGDSAKR
jgi:hypothetical protein